MKKILKSWLFTAVCSILLSIGSIYAQAGEFPPIQKFVNKIENRKFEENMSQIEMYSQKLANGSFTLKKKGLTSGQKYRSEYTDIVWGNFKEVRTSSLKNADEYLECKFYFTTNISIQLFSDEKEFWSNKTNKSFSCFILSKDQQKFLKVMSDWEAKNKRN